MNVGRVMRAAVFVACVCYIPVVAQDRDETQGEQELTVEDVFLRRIELMIVQEKAFSDDRESKMSAVEQIEDMLLDGNASKDDYVPVLEYLAMEGITRQVREARHVVNNFPELRRKSAELLGHMGGEDAKDALILILIKDDEPMVKAEAAFALGRIGLNENQETVEALVYAFDRMNTVLPDQNFALAIVNAFEKLDMATGQGLAEDAYRVLINVLQGGYLRRVKTKALQVLENMRQMQR